MPFINDDFLLTTKAANKFFNAKIDNSGVNAYTGRVK